MRHKILLPLDVSNTQTIIEYRPSDQLEKNAYNFLVLF